VGKDLFSVDYLKELADERVVPFLINLFIAALVFYIGRWIARIVTRTLVKLMKRAKVEEDLVKFVSDVIYTLLYAIVIIASLERLGVKTTAAIAIIGAAGLAVGLALQGSLGNFASGVMLILFKPYRVGDLVSLAGHVGHVDAIKVFNTVIITLDGKKVIIPNGQITGSVIENLSTRGKIRIDMVFGIGYGDDIGKAMRVMEEVVKAHPKVLAEPEPVVKLSELADSSVNFIVRPWSKTEDYWDVKFDVTRRMKERFDEEGISIPFPQRDVHLHQVGA
jgi:small conductance mechanosensitive channel